MDKAEWWKGNFPLWIVVMLLTLIGYFGRREVVHNDTFHDKADIDINALQIRVSVLEQQYREINNSLTRIEVFQKQLNDYIINTKRP